MLHFYLLIYEQEKSTHFRYCCLFCKINQINYYNRNNKQKIDSICMFMPPYNYIIVFGLLPCCATDKQIRGGKLSTLGTHLNNIPFCFQFVKVRNYVC